MQILCIAIRYFGIYPIFSEGIVDGEMFKSGTGATTDTLVKRKSNPVHGR